MTVLDQLLDRGRLPDGLIRFGIRRLLASRLRDEGSKDRALGGKHHAAHLELLRRSPLALFTAEANEQHYEVPAQFFATVLGPALKYSACAWPAGVDNLADAETAALGLVCGRAGLHDGQRVLDLGCGWGSFSLYAAARYPRSSFLAVSNSHGQRRFIEAEARRRGLHNLEVRTHNIVNFAPEQRFDRIVSVEMFEHLRNYGELLERIAGWLEEDGRLFVHIFTHARYGYFFTDEGASDWMARHFFTGGQMPARDTLTTFDDHMLAVQRWDIGGEHYARTAEAWLQNLDANRVKINDVLAEQLGKQEAAVQINRWRVFFLACAELFGYRGGKEWGVTHYLLRPRRGAASHPEPIAVAS